MNWILSLLWVFVIEYIQNAPFIIGLVLGLVGIKRGLARWKGFLIMVAGSFVCAGLIVGTDWIKVMATTHAPDLVTLFDVLYMGVMFSAVCGILLIYYSLTSKVKNPLWADIVFGITLGALGGFAEAGDINIIFTHTLVVVLHMLGFALAAGSLVTLLRYSAQAESGKALFGKINLAIFVMTLSIALFDYFPFLEG